MAWKILEDRALNLSKDKTRRRGSPSRRHSIYDKRGLMRWDVVAKLYEHRTGEKLTQHYVAIIGNEAVKKMAKELTHSHG